MSPIIAALVMAALPTLALSLESPCSYVAGYAGVSDWLVTQGPAVATSSQGRFTAKLYDTRLGGNESHRVDESIENRQVSATLKNLFSDADERLIGRYVLAQLDRDAPSKVFESLTAQNGSTFVAIKCYDSKANLTAARTPLRANAEGNAGR
jgi:hypothetical protein